MAEPTMRVKAVYTYPIKSLRGVSAPSLPAMYAGFPHDRRFMLYKTGSNKPNMHISEYTEMCLFTTALEPSASPTPTHVAVTYTKDHTFDQPDRKVGDEVLEVPLDPDTGGLATVEIVMHSSPCLGYDMGETYNRWFSERFGYDVQLLYIGDNKRKVLGNMPPAAAAAEREQQQQRQGATKSGGGGGGGGWLSGIASTASSLIGTVTGSGQTQSEVNGVDDGLSFADVAPYLVISETSWENAQRRLPAGEVMDITKFRPNIVVEGAPAAFDEDYWAEMQIGADAVVVMTNNCARCNSLNVDYDTGKVGAGESGKILKKLQSDRRVDQGAKYSPVFGRYGFLAKVPEGKAAAEIKVGDEVRIVKRNDAHTRLVWPKLST